MIILIRRKKDPAADRIEEKFCEMILAYKTDLTDSEETGPLPEIRDGEAVISGEENINEWMQELEAELKWQRSISGDGCYIDPDSGKVC